MDEDRCLQKFPPCIRKQILNLCIENQLGISGLKLTDISPMPPKHISDPRNSICNCFIFRIPFAGKLLKWEVIFNPEDYCFAPDFDFNDDYFFADPDLDMVCEHVPSLVNWNADEAGSLTAVLKELLAYYKKVQVHRLQLENVYSHVYNEYRLLMNDNSMSQDDVEVIVENNAVHFLISIPVDFSNIPDYAQPVDIEDNANLYNPSKNSINMKFTYSKLDGSKKAVSIQPSPQVEQVLGSTEVFMHRFSKDTLLVEYVHYMSKAIKDAVETVVFRHKMKKEYIMCLVAVRRDCLVEYDAERFSFASFICEVDDYYCLVKVIFGDTFPEEKPTVLLCSLYCLDNKKSCIEKVKNYPFDPNWTCDEMIGKLFDHLVDVLPKFKSHTH